MTDILRVLGAENVAATNGMVGYDRVTDEHIVRWNPEWIVAGADRGQVSAVRERLLGNPAIAATAPRSAARLSCSKTTCFCRYRRLRQLSSMPCPSPSTVESHRDRSLCAVACRTRDAREPVAQDASPAASTPS